MSSIYNFQKYRLYKQYQQQYKQYQLALMYQNYIRQKNQLAIEDTPSIQKTPDQKSLKSQTLQTQNILKDQEVNKPTSPNLKNTKNPHNDTKIYQQQQEFVRQISYIPFIERMPTLARLKTIYHFKAEHNYSDRVELLENYIVRKKIAYTRLGYHLFVNEVRSLLKLLNKPHVPQIVGINPKNFEIYMTYCGLPISIKNLPQDWKDQFREISDVLVSTNTNSNDMILRNTTVLDNKIYIIDFGLNNQFNEDIHSVLRSFYYRLQELSTQGSSSRQGYRRAIYR